jgi:hypothetical protein
MQRIMLEDPFLLAQKVIAIRPAKHRSFAGLIVFKKSIIPITVLPTNITDHVFEIEHKGTD